MLNSAILEVIVGMLFVYSLLSVLVTQINTVIANTLKLRASHLKTGIEEIVSDPTFQVKIFTHPLIKLLKTETVSKNITPKAAEALVKNERLNRNLSNINYLEPETFVNVLMNIIKVDADNELFGALREVVSAMPVGNERRELLTRINRLVQSGEGLDELREFIANLQDPTYREQLGETLNAIDQLIGQLGLEPKSIVSLLAGLQKIKNERFRTALETILATAHTLDEAQGQIRKWFDEGMNRASEKFTRTMQAFSLLIGLLIAIVLNVDTLHLGRTLWEDPALREAVSTAAQEAAPSLQTPPQPVEEGSEGAAETDALQATQDSADEATQTLDQLLELRLPLGWYYRDLSELPDDDPRRDDGRNVWNLQPGNGNSWAVRLAMKIIGLLLTMIALAQGAPFWFNLMNRIMFGNQKKAEEEK